MLHRSPVVCLCAVPEAVDGPQQLCLFLGQGLTCPALHLQHFVPFQLTDHHLAKVGKHGAGVRVKGARLVVNDAPAQVAKAQSIRGCSRYNANAMHCNKFVQQANAGWRHSQRAQAHTIRCDQWRACSTLIGKHQCFNVILLLPEHTRHCCHVHPAHQHRSGCAGTPVREGCS